MGTVITLLLYYLFSFYLSLFLAVLHSMWDLSSLTRDRTHMEVWGLNHWIIREVPVLLLKIES